ncbi:MAG: serine/threonine protein kinase [bacterium]|nr:serine/threonine protein kinase [bacterium]
METCSQCGGSLDNSGSCSLCLLELGISSAGNAQPDSELGPMLMPSAEALNRQLPHLEITRMIGRGGMGAIYHARQKNLDRDVAVKVIAREVARDTTFVERFEREAKTLARLSHPNIVTVYDFGHTEDGQVYLVMEYVDGINLREAMTSGSIGSEEAIDVIRSICQALQYAHRRGVVHRDIKPENILLGEDGTLKVADFGIAKIIDESVRTPTLTATRQVLGSLHYLAPEHLESPNEVDHRVDIYALGVISYELLTGQLPLGRYEPPTVIRPDLDPRMDAVVMKMLSRKPRNRYQQASDVSQAFELPANWEDSNHQAAFSTSNSQYDGETRMPRSVSVPFSCDAFGGFAEAVGVIYTKQEPSRCLVVEYRIRDAISGSVKSQTHVVEIPLQQLTRAELAAGLFSSKFILMTERISGLGNLPNAETGRVQLRIKRSDHELAEAVLEAIGFGTQAGRKSRLASASGEAVSGVGPMNAVDVVSRQTGDRESSWLIFALMLLLCALFNAGILFIVEFIFVRELNDIALIAASVSCAVLFAPIAALQLWTGLVCLWNRPRNLGLAASVASMLPLAPAWPFSFPLGLWAFLWMRHEPGQAGAYAANPPARTGWGTTTMLFVRESRWGKLVALGNILAFLAVVAGLFIYRLGLYPVTMQYRIVDSQIDASQVTAAVQQRLATLEDVEITQQADAQSNMIQISLMQRQRDLAAALLAIEQNIQLAWLVEPSALAEPIERGNVGEGVTSEWTFDVAKGLALPEAYLQPSSLGGLSRADSQPLLLQPDAFSKIVSSKLSPLGTSLTIELTQQGKSALLDSIDPPADGKSPPDMLGLVVDGVLIGFAAQSQISGRTIEFEIANHGEVTAESIMAAARGPAIPSALEYMRK